MRNLKRNNANKEEAENNRVPVIRDLERDETDFSSDPNFFP